MNETNSNCCPFCGEEDDLTVKTREILKNDHAYHKRDEYNEEDVFVYYVLCNKCKARGSETKPLKHTNNMYKTASEDFIQRRTEDIAIKLWNNTIDKNTKLLSYEEIEEKAEKEF